METIWNQREAIWLTADFDSLVLERNCTASRYFNSKNIRTKKNMMKDGNKTAKVHYSFIQENWLK